MTTLVHEHVRNLALTTPNALAVTSNEAQISYLTLQNLVESFTARLLQDNTKKSDRVAFLSPPSLDFLVAYLSITSLGAIFVGLNPKYTNSELQHVITDAEPVALYGRKNIRDRNYENVANTVTRGTSLRKSLHLYDNFDELLKLPPSSKQVQLDYFDPCAIIYTSGTTGKAKGALIPHGGLAECCKAQIDAVGLEHPTALNNLPINHIGCIGDITAFTLMASGTLVFQEKFDPAAVLDLIEDHKITWWGQIPTMFQLALDVQDKVPRDLTSLQRILTSGAPAPIALIKRLRKLCPYIQNGYGMTETVGSITWVTDGPDEILSTTIGKPIPPYKVRIADEFGVPTPNNQSGEIQVKGPMHMLGYWRNKLATQSAYTPDGWLRTGDLAKRRSDSYLVMVGRIKEVFKSGGYNVYPREIEQALEAIDGIQSASVISVPDALYYEVGCAFIKFDVNTSPNMTQIKNTLMASLANYKVPKHFRTLETFPLLPNGKIDKAALEHIYSS